MKLALAQMNPVVGDIRANTARMTEVISQAAGRGADLVVFSELSVVGYPPKDLLLKPRFIDDNRRAVDELAKSCRDCGAMVGFACPHEGATGLNLHNAAALLAEGRVIQTYFKQLLPTYDVFDERRYFEPAKSPQVVEFGGKRIGLTICEDIWQGPEDTERSLYDIRPLAELSDAGVDLVVNMSASPFVLGKPAFRSRCFGGHCRRYKLPLAYVNQVGGNDELVFDGNSCFIDGDGKVLAQARDFAEDLLLIDVENPSASRCEMPREGIASVHAALVLGLRDYVRKCGFKRVVIGLSGGIDSAVTAALAVQALGHNNVTGVAMPSRYSSDHSLTDAAALARNLNIRYLTIPIEPAHAAMESMLADAFTGRGSDITEENIQARLRGNILMSLSNKFGCLLLTTGNKSELAVGYCTLYGDMAGGLAVISDVPKTMIYELARFINRDGELIPQSSITKPPSAELKPNQTDQDSLPPYEILDEILRRYVEQEQSRDKIVADGFDDATVARVINLVDRSEYKRKQAAPGLKVTSRAFGFGRRMPIAQNYR
ncbi:MAG: NAD+ synthase [Sedimentisphaerales bacterium]|nr:NAD+ synthase [Sedimentisphaerales bacterium]